MKKVTALFCGISVVLAMFLASPSLAQTKIPEKSTALSSLMLKADMRQLWEDHSQWTRNVIFCLVDSLPGIEQAKARLLKNQADIGNAVKPYYGADAANRLTALLETHIKIAVDVVNSAKNKKYV